MKSDFIKIVEDIIRSCKDIEFDQPGFGGSNFLNHDGSLYYRWLARYIQVHTPKRSLELGRREGNSLYAMSYYLPDDCILDSYDLNMGGNVVKKPNVNVFEYSGNYSELDLSEYNFMFIDINGVGEKEYEIYNQANEQGFEGIIAWDDVGSRWVENKEFWDLLPKDIKYKAPLHEGYGDVECFGFTYHENSRRH